MQGIIQMLQAASEVYKSRGLWENWKVAAKSKHLNHCKCIMTPHFFPDSLLLYTTIHLCEMNKKQMENVIADLVAVFFTSTLHSLCTSANDCSRQWKIRAMEFPSFIKLKIVYMCVCVLPFLVIAASNY